MQGAMLNVNVWGTRKPLDFHLGIPVAADRKGPPSCTGGVPESLRAGHGRPEAACQAAGTFFGAGWRENADL